MDKRFDVGEDGLDTPRPKRVWKSRKKKHTLKVGRKRKSYPARMKELQRALNTLRRATEEQGFLFGIRTANPALDTPEHRLKEEAALLKSLQAEGTVRLVFTKAIRSAARGRLEAQARRAARQAKKAAEAAHTTTTRGQG